MYRNMSERNSAQFVHIPVDYVALEKDTDETQLDNKDTEITYDNSLEKDGTKVPPTSASSHKGDGHEVALSQDDVKSTEFIADGAKYKDRPVTRGSELAELTPRKAELGRIPSPTAAEKRKRERRVQQKQAQRPRLPNNMVKLATVTMTSKQARESSAMREHATYIEQKKLRSQKLIRWDDANNARPPLRIDMDTPSPTAYTLRNKPLREDNSPAWSFSGRTFVEHEGGSRTSWQKTWFQSPNIWQQKTDFFSDRRWPEPTYYQLRPTIGRQVTGDMLTYPAFSVGIRRSTSLTNKVHYVDEGSEVLPSPGDYDIQRSFTSLSARSPSFTHGMRRGGTRVHIGQKESGPGPGSYDPNNQKVQTHRPAFTIQGQRRHKSHALGPFATL